MSTETTRHFKEGRRGGSVMEVAEERDYTYIYLSLH